MLAEGLCIRRTNCYECGVLMSVAGSCCVSLVVLRGYLKLDFANPVTRASSGPGCLRSQLLSLCARKKVCACVAASWQWSMTAGAVAWALLALSVLTQLWCACPSRYCPRWLVYLGSSRHEAPVHSGAVTGRCWSCAVCTVSCGTFRHTGTGTPRRAGIWCDSETVVAGYNTRCGRLVELLAQPTVVALCQKEGVCV